MSDLANDLWIQAGERLTPTERLYLASLTQHEGFPVLKKMFDECCRIVTEYAVRLDPENERYESLVKVRQMRARFVNEFCGAIRKNFEANNSMLPKEKDDNARPNSSATN